MKRRHAPLLLLVIGAILAAPAGGQVVELSVTATATPSSVQTGDNVSLTATVDGGVGPYTVRYYYASAGTACSDASWSAIGGPVSDPPYTVNWTPGSGGSPYAIKAEAADSTAPDALRGCGTDGPITVQDPPPADTDPPTPPVLTFETGPSAHPVGLTLYVKTDGPAGETYALRATTNDTGSGVKEVEFPGGSKDTAAPYRSSPYDLGELSGTNTVTARDNANPVNESQTPFTVVADTTGPAEVAVSYTDGNDIDGTIVVATSDGTDAGAGISPGSGVLERAVGTLTDTAAGPSCSNLGPWQQTTPTNTISRLQCAAYRYTVSDNVGNSSTDTGVGAAWFDDRDTVDPANVTGARLRAGDHVVTLTYRIPTTDFERVKIFRSIAGVGGSERLAFNGRAQRFVDRSVFNGTRYVYEIVTYDAAGNRPDPGVFMRGVPRSRFLLAPRDGAILRRPPLLDWKARRRARFYNLKVLRDAGPGPAREVLSVFPRRSKFQMKSTWRYKGHIRRFSRGTYFWYVWPRIGGHYGKLMGWQRFVVPRR
jgi:hypothetical protein